MLVSPIGTEDGSEALAEAEMGRFAHPALGATVGLMALCAVAVTTGSAFAQSGTPAAAPLPGGTQAAPEAGSAPTGGAGSGQSDGQPAAGADRQGSAGAEDGRPVPGCPARRNKLDLIV